MLCISVRSFHAAFASPTVGSVGNPVDGPLRQASQNTQGTSAKYASR